MRINQINWQKHALSIFDTLLVPVIALLVFYQFVDDVDNLFKSSSRYTDHPARTWRSQRNEEFDRDEVKYQPQHTYVTDEFTDFAINAAGCDSEGRKRKLNASRARPIQYDGLFLVSTSAKNLFNRRIFRHMYSTYSNTRPYRIKCIFLVGRSKDNVIQANIEREDYQYRDMVQGRFIDHYHNLTYKTIMGYRWAHLNCKNVTVILKMDDDVYLDIFKFFEYFLPIIPHRKRTMYGFLNYHPHVFREGKYRVAVEEYKEKEYPNFCSGFFVVPTADFVSELYEASKIVSYLLHQSLPKVDSKFQHHTAFRFWVRCNGHTCILGADMFDKDLSDTIDLCELYLPWHRLSQGRQTADGNDRRRTGPVKELRLQQFFRLEDVFTYGLVREKMLDVQLVHLDVISYEWYAYRDCVREYKYRCKLMAVEVPASELLTYFDKTMESRKRLELPGGSLGL